MDRKLASIQKITEILPHNNADTLEIAKILGWQVVVRKGEFKVNDWCVFFEIDAILPHEPWCAFLVKKDDKPDKPIRIKTIRLRGQVSQGLALPIISFVNTPLANWSVLTEGADVTEALGVTLYEPVIPAQLAGKVKGKFPSFLIKTETLRLQSFPEVLKEFEGVEVYATIKVDGSSMSAYYNPELRPTDPFGICSRNLDLIKDDNNTYWKMEGQYNLFDKLKSLEFLAAIQAEVYGRGIQNNRLGTSEVAIAVFDIFNIKERKYLNYYAARDIAEELGLPVVTTLHVGPFYWKSIDELLEYVNTIKYSNGRQAEGIVIRPVEERYSPILEGRLAIKVISNKYLEEHKE